MGQVGNVFGSDAIASLRLASLFFTGPSPEKLKYGKTGLGEVRCI